MPSEPPRSRSARRESRFDTNPSSETSASQLHASYCQTSPSDAGPPVVPSGSGRFTGRSAPRRRPYACDETIFLSGASSRAVTVSISATWRARDPFASASASRRSAGSRSSAPSAPSWSVWRTPPSGPYAASRTIALSARRATWTATASDAFALRAARAASAGVASAAAVPAPARRTTNFPVASRCARRTSPAAAICGSGTFDPVAGQEHDDELLPGARDRRDGEEGGEEEGAHEASGHGAARVEVDFAGEADDVDVDGSFSGPGPGPARAGGGSAQRSTGATAHALAAGSSSHATLRSRGGRGTWTASG